MAGKLSLRVFISSPGDVAEERALAGRVFRRLGKEFDDAVTLDLILWEHEPLFAHSGFQEQIPRPSQCDLVVSILWARLGTRLPADFAPEPGRPAPTGTEFEVRDALNSYERNGKPNLLIYRKRSPPHLDMASADAEERFRQYKELTEFCRTAFYDAQGASIVAHHGFVDGADFERRLTEHARKWLIREIDKAGQHHSRPRWTHGSPFRGLQAFDEEHQEVFFGRSQAIGELIQRFTDVETADSSGNAGARLLLVSGMSGNGKTSLIRAGLLPFLADRPVEGIAAWLPVSLRPSEVDDALPEAGALGVLATRICRALPSAASLGISAARLAEGLRAEAGSAVARIETYLAAEAAARRVRPEQTRLLVFVDQLEELFTIASVVPQAPALLDTLATLAASPFLWVVATLRSDFAHHLEAHPKLMELLRRSPPYTLLPPRGDELSDMIREPALAAGLEFDQRDGVTLDRELLRDASANPESLPLLEYALEQLYDRRDGKTLLWDVYRPVGREGGLRGAVVDVAEGLLANLGPDADAVFRRVMRELTSVGEDGSATRRYAPLAAFGPAGPERALITKLVDARLAVTDRQGANPVVCLAHEALLQSWPRVQAWLQKESTLLRIRDELQRDAQAWVSHGRSDGWLGIAADKLANLSQLEREGMVPAGVAAEYAERSRRRARRNRALRTTAVASICVLAVAATVAGVLAAVQRDRARAEAATADRTSRFMVSLFKLADPGENRGNSVTVREVLDRGAREVGHGLEHEARVRADLRTAMGEAYTGLGLYDAAKKLLGEARSDQEAARVSPESRVHTLVASGAVLDLAGDYDGAKALLLRAISLAEADLPRDSLLLSEARDNLADVYTQQEKFAEAEALLKAALAVDRTRGAEGVPILAQTLNILGIAYYSEGRLADAEPLFREALTLRTARFGEHDAQTAEAINNLASLLYQQGRYDETRVLLARALPIYREIYGAEHPLVASILNNLGRSELMAGHVAESIPSLERAVELHEKRQGPTHDDLIMPLNSLAMAHLFQGEVPAAQRSLDRALSIARAKQHPMLDQVVVNAADLELSSHRPDVARPLLEESRKLLEARYPPDKAPGEAWRFAVWDSVNARYLAEKQRGEEARAAYAAARPVLLKRFGAQGFYVKRLDQRAAATDR